MSGKQGATLTDTQREVVLAELATLLGSAPFRTSKRCSDFLRHVVEHTLNGQVDNLKERSIGIELFHLPPDFDTGQHAIVRVTANEVRKRLAQHYHSESSVPHAVRIELPPGSYVAEFRWENGLQEPVRVEPVELPAEPKRPRARTVALLAVIAVLLGAVAVWRARQTGPAQEKASPSADQAPAAAVAPSPEEIRILAGATARYTDRNGRVWDPDRFFTGGTVWFRPSEKILRTLDPDIYRRQRAGDFRYDIPLKPGSYEMHLHFAETGLADFISAESSGEGQRLFRVTANGTTILDLFDVVADAAGANVATERVFRDVSPAEDGHLHLRFEPIRGSAMVSAIELIPVSPGTVRPVRIRAGWPTSWQDEAGQQWLADCYFAGGNALVRTKNPVQSVLPNLPETALYTSERWGHFSYAIPVAEGRYTVTLRFSEGHYGSLNTGRGGVGSRLFDVYCNGVALLRNFDIFKEAGGEGRPVSRTFSGIRPTAQGKIVLYFVPVRGMACVNAIEVTEETR